MAKKLWGGRFAKTTHPLVEAFTRSIQYDYKLADCDILGSMIHVEVLRKANYLTTSEASSLAKALVWLHATINNGKFKPDMSCEDIHTDIQNKLIEKAGDVVLKLHTARSRNEQVAFSTKLYCLVELASLKKDIAALVKALKASAVKNTGVVVPGFTHMQHAQPVYLKDQLSAYADMLKRDSEMLEFIASHIKLTMGSGALAGTPIKSKIYKIKVPAAFKDTLAGYFDVEPTANSLDGVSDRDFVVKTIGALAVIGMHLSRMAEDLIIWNSKEFGFVELDDAFCTGSSLMPQKKNPDVLELVRGYAGRLSGNFTDILTMMKGLPLAYNRDMQLDKEPLFESIEIVSSELKVLAPLIGTMTFNKARIEEQLEDESLYATDLVYYLVAKGIAFKNAHTIVGRLIKYSIDNAVEIKSMTNAELARFSDKFSRNEILKLFNPLVSVQSKKSVNRKS